MRRSPRPDLLLLALTLALQLFTSSAEATPRDPRLAAVSSFAFAIGDDKLESDVHTRLAGYDLVVVDGESATRDQIDAMHGNGTIVLGYLAVGSIEKGRFWYRAASKYKLDYWPDWGEWYANAASPGFRDLIAKNVAPKILAKGFDGLFLDNVDMIEAHPHQKKGMRLLVRRLAKATHSRDGFLFAQNGEASIGPSLKYLDGWNREDVGYTYDFEKKKYAQVPANETMRAISAIRRIGNKGLLTMATAYTGGAGTDAAAAVDLICGAGAIPFVSNILLTRIDPPRSCAG